MAELAQVDVVDEDLLDRRGCLEQDAEKIRHPLCVEAPRRTGATLLDGLLDEDAGAMGAHDGGLFVVGRERDIDVTTPLVAEVTRYAQVGRRPDAVPLADVRDGNGIAPEADACPAEGAEQRRDDVGPRELVTRRGLEEVAVVTRDRRRKADARRL